MIEGLLLLQLIGLLLVFAHAWGDFVTAPRLPRAAATGSRLPSLAVLIPARNEQHNIVRCLQSVLAQDYPGLAVIVIDDGSEDATARLVETIAAGDARVKLIEAPPRPDGWCGKSWALSVGVQHANDAAFYCFLDADVTLAPCVLRRAVRYATVEQLCMVSLLPALTTLTFWEKVIQPVMAMLMFVAQPLRLVNRPDSSLAVANGQFLLVARWAYQQIGGHAAIRGELVEDVELARTFKQNGLPVSLVVATDHMQTRMYSDLAALWEGWGKTIHPYLQREPVRVWLGVAAVVALMGLPFVTLGLSALLSPAALALNTASVALILINVMVFRRVSDQQLAHGLLWPLGLGMLVALFAARTLGAWRGQQVMWKGRRYS